MYTIQKLFTQLAVCVFLSVRIRNFVGYSRQGKKQRKNVRIQLFLSAKLYRLCP